MVEQDKLKNISKKKTDLERIQKYLGVTKLLADNNQRGVKVNGVILFIDRRLHDSGYPFLHAYAYNHESESIIDIGWHDHFLVKKQPVNIDSFGSNIMHIYPWTQGELWELSCYYVSSLELTEYGVLR